MVTSLNHINYTSITTMFPRLNRSGTSKLPFLTIMYSVQFCSRC